MGEEDYTFFRQCILAASPLTENLSWQSFDLLRRDKKDKEIGKRSGVYHCVSCSVVDPERLCFWSAGSVSSCAKMT